MFLSWLSLADQNVKVWHAVQTNSSHSVLFFNFYFLMHFLSFPNSQLYDNTTLTKVEVHHFKRDFLTLWTCYGCIVGSNCPTLISGVPLIAPSASLLLIVLSYQFRVKVMLLQLDVAENLETLKPQVETLLQACAGKGISVLTDCNLMQCPSLSYLMQWISGHSLPSGARKQTKCFPCLQ